MPSTVSAMVKREADYFASKWLFVTVLEDGGGDWAVEAGSLRAWLLAEAVVAAKRLLCEMERGQLSVECFRSKVVYEFGEMETVVLAEYFILGPEQEYANEVSTWIKLVCMAKAPSGWGGMQRALWGKGLRDNIPQMVEDWGRKFPSLKEVYRSTDS